MKRLKSIEWNREKTFFVVGFGIASSFFALGSLIKKARKYKRKSNKEKHHHKETAAPKKNVIKVAGIEIGGTSCLVAIGEKILDDKRRVADIRFVGDKKLRVETTTPAETMEKIMNFLSKETFEEIGIAGFGPICVDENNPNYGQILNTPKEKWKFFDLLKFVKERIPLAAGIPKLETDVNAPAFLEFEKGGHGAKSNLVYITIGTGVGVGLIMNGKPVHGLLHPEGGHIAIQKAEADKDFEGVCCMHKSCVEGYTTNVSIAKRKGLKNVEEVANLPDSDPVWDLLGYYLGQFCSALTLICSPEVIIIGGGVSKREVLFDKIRENFIKANNGYIQSDKFDNLANYIKPPKFSDNAGIFGAFMIAGSH